MLRALPDSANDPSVEPTAADSSRALYARLLHYPEESLADAREFLRDRLRAAEALPHDLPDDPRRLPAWSRQASLRVGRQYRRYLVHRRAGAGRRYFRSRAHALDFIRRVGPTKLVDGAWLAGLLPYWPDVRFHPLIRTYLEELGDGRPELNHVVLYQRLLNAHGLADLDALDPAHYEQGAIQLALGRLAAEFLPEVIGYNLGYEQPPLHLLITAYELDELGIDPYYFTLHVTIDNADSGHADKAVRALLGLLPRWGDAPAFYRRVAAGYRLNALGTGSLAIIESFDLERELVRVLAAKAELGAQLHADRCRLGGRTVNEWLSAPEQVPAFLACLQEAGWIRRHQDPRHSRFWQLIDGERAPMFGVFSGYERQLIHDWIAGDALRRVASFRARQRRQGAVAGDPACLDAADPDVRAFEARLAAAGDRPAVMAMLADAMGPAAHHTPAGLLATRRFAQLLG